MIGSYSFGKIVINGEEYNSDVIIYPDHVNNNWLRKSGHVLNKDDIREIIQNKPDVLIVGTGNAGMLKVPYKTRNYITDRGIELIIKKTSEACTVFNELSGSAKKVVGAFHLTC